MWQPQPTTTNHNQPQPTTDNHIKEQVYETWLEETSVIEGGASCCCSAAKLQDRHHQAITWLLTFVFYLSPDCVSSIVTLLVIIALLFQVIHADQYSLFIYLNKQAAIWISWRVSLHPVFWFSNRASSGHLLEHKLIFWSMYAFITFTGYSEQDMFMSSANRASLATVSTTTLTTNETSSFKDTNSCPQSDSSKLTCKEVMDVKERIRPTVRGGWILFVVFAAAVLSLFLVYYNFPKLDP